MKIVPPWGLAFGIVMTMLIGLTISLHAAWIRHLRGAIMPDPEAERLRLLQTDVDFANRSIQEGPARAFWLYLADDAVQLPAGAEPIYGRTSIVAGMEAWPQTVLVWHPQAAQVAQSGDLGYTWGVFECRKSEPDGGLKISHGKYVNVWRRNPDGQWKVVVDTGNTSPALTE